MSYKITVFGATGSIGDSTLDIIRQHPEQFEVYALSAHSQLDKLLLLAKEFHPKVLLVPTLQDKQYLLKYSNGLSFEVRVGQEGLIETAYDKQTDTIVCAIVGTAGLPSAYAAAKAGKRILLANKEALVASGELFINAVKQNKATLLPLDSEHNAIFQCLQGNQNQQEIHQIILTASGGPFRNTKLSELAFVTPEQACNHPTWDMGRKISVDSATMLNKGLEIIEAKWLFGLPDEKIKVLIHPESVVHSLVHYCDGSLLAQLGHADMRIPISYAMSYPQRINNQAKPFLLEDLTQLNFSSPSFERYPCLALSYEALKVGQAACLVLNASNEMAVDAFLKNKISFLSISETIDLMLNKTSFPCLEDIDDVLAFDEEVRLKTNEHLKNNLN